MVKNATFRQAMNERFSGDQLRDGRIVSLVDRSQFHNFRDEIAKMFAQLRMDPESVAKNSTLDQNFEYRPDTSRFINWFGCARTWKDSIDCANLTRIESVASRRCTTLLHRGAMLYDAINRPEVFNSTYEQPSFHNYFDAKEVAKLVIDFEPEDYGDLKRQIGARISFHDSSSIAGVGDLDYFITRGYRYDFSIDRLDTKIIGEPYHRCLDYHKANLDKYKAQVEPRVSLASHTCYQNCVVKNVLNRSNCWPATQPYFRNDSFDPELKVRFCPWSKSYYYELVRLNNLRLSRKLMQANATRQNQSEQSKQNLDDRSRADVTQSDYSRAYRKINHFCLSKCTMSCRMVDYSVSVTRSAWPSDVKILFDETGRMRMLRHCCALIVIKFAHFHYNIHEYTPKYEITNIVGDLGGLLAFWLGLSIMSIYHAIQKLIGFCSRRSSSKIRQWTSLVV
jgi:hypothetical protein